MQPSVLSNDRPVLVSQRGSSTLTECRCANTEHRIVLNRFVSLLKLEEGRTQTGSTERKEKLLVNVCVVQLYCSRRVSSVLVYDNKSLII